MNYRNGRFCEDHILQWTGICGIIPCGRPVHTPGALTCDNPSHKSWHKAYSERFKRLNFPGVQRVMRKKRRQMEIHRAFRSIFPLSRIILMTTSSTLSERSLSTAFKQFNGLVVHRLDGANATKVKACRKFFLSLTVSG